MQKLSPATQEQKTNVFGLFSQKPVRIKKKVFNLTTGKSPGNSDKDSNEVWGALIIHRKQRKYWFTMRADFFALREPHCSIWENRQVHTQGKKGKSWKSKKILHNSTFMIFLLFSILPVCTYLLILPFKGSESHFIYNKSTRTREKPLSVRMVGMLLCFDCIHCYL